MARKRTRFARLKRALKLAGGVAKPGSELDNFIKFENGDETHKIKVTNKVPAAKRKRVGIALYPFNITPGATPGAADRYRATITIYSNEGRANVGLTDANLGYFALNKTNNAGDNYFPAQLIIFVPGEGESEETSAITKKKYKRKNGKSYTIPFGRAASAITEGEETRRTFLAQEAKKGVGSIKASSVSYNPEEFSNAKQDLESALSAPAEGGGNG